MGESGGALQSGQNYITMRGKPIGVKIVWSRYENVKLVEQENNVLKTNAICPGAGHQVDCTLGKTSNEEHIDKRALLTHNSMDEPCTGVPTVEHN